MSVGDWSNILSVIGSLSQQEADRLRWQQGDAGALLDAQRQPAFVAAGPERAPAA